MNAQSESAAWLAPCSWIQSQAYKFKNSYELCKQRVNAVMVEEVECCKYVRRFKRLMFLEREKQIYLHERKDRSLNPLMTLEPDSKTFVSFRRLLCFLYLFFFVSALWLLISYGVVLTWHQQTSCSPHWRTHTTWLQDFTRLTRSNVCLFSTAAIVIKQTLSTKWWH